MANLICGVVINSLPNFSHDEIFVQKKLKSKFVKTKGDNLSPENIIIGFKNNCTLIFLDQLFFYNISDKEELTPLEKDINVNFKGSNFLIPIINETVNFVGYSYVENGNKIRTKAVVNNQIFLDFGNLTEIEEEYYLKLEHFINNETNRKVENYKKLLNNETELKIKKNILEIGDELINKFNSNIFKERYLDGSLDEKIIENKFINILGCAYYELIDLDFIQFPRKKFHLKKESLKEFIKIAYEELK